MGTGNFQGCGKFGIYAYVCEYDKETYDETYPELSDNEKYNIFLDEASYLYGEEARHVQKKIDDLNTELTFYKLGLADGYYEGIEVILKEKPYNEDIETLHDILQNDRMWNHYDDVRMTKKHRVNVQKIYDRECDKIEAFLQDLVDNEGWMRFDVTAVFSSGETWYKKSDYRPSPGPDTDKSIADFFSSHAKKRKKSAKEKPFFGVLKPKRWAR